LKTRLGFVGLLAVLMLAVPATALAQGSDGGDDGVLFRIAGDTVVEEGDSPDAVVVISGDLAVAGDAGAVVVINGSVVLSGATVDTLVVVSGDALLGEGSEVTGDVVLFSSTLVQDENTTIGGSIVEGFEGSFFVGLWIFLLIVAVGFGIVAIVSALVFAAVAPRSTRATTKAIMTDFGAVVLAGVVFWLGLPVASVLILITIVGIPVALTVWFVVLPLMGFLGLLVSGIWIGDLIIARGRGEGHPYLAAFLGTLLLVIVGMVPVFGGMLITLASLLGGSALALVAWRNFRGEPAPVDTARETVAETGEQPTDL
jgi:hypothetical protein